MFFGAEIDYTICDSYWGRYQFWWLSVTSVAVPLILAVSLGAVLGSGPPLLCSWNVDSGSFWGNIHFNLKASRFLRGVKLHERYIPHCWIDLIVSFWGQILGVTWSGWPVVGWSGRWRWWRRRWRREVPAFLWSFPTPPIPPSDDPPSTCRPEVWSSMHSTAVEKKKYLLTDFSPNQMQWHSSRCQLWLRSNTSPQCVWPVSPHPAPTHHLTVHSAHVHNVHTGEKTIWYVARQRRRGEWAIRGLVGWPRPVVT